MSKSNGKKKAAAPRQRPDTREIGVAPINDKYSSYPSNGLTPVRLAAIFREADAGDVLRQMELFEEMEEKDPHLFSQLQTRKNAVTGLDYEIIPFSDEEGDKEIAAWVEEQLKGIEDFEDVEMDLLDAIGKGVAFEEIIWGYEDGHTVVKALKHRHQKRFFWDEEDALKVYTKEEPSGLYVPENKFIVHRYKARSGHPSRAGVLRVTAWMYLFKNYDLKDWVSFCEVYGMPLRLGKYNPAASEADKRALMDALIQIGTDAAGIIPDGTEIDFKEASKVSSADIYERLARYCDEQMSKAILGQTLTSDAGGGSYAQSKTHNEVRHDLTVADCKALAATLRRDLIRPLVLYNFGEGVRIPSIRYDCEEAEDQQQTAEIYKALICDMGLKIPTSHLYKKFSIPKPEPGEEIAKPGAGALPLDPGGGPLLAHKAQLIGDRQKEVDGIADAGQQKSGPAFDTLAGPVLDAVAAAGSLEELEQLLGSETAVRELMERMDAGDLETLLQKAMLFADLEGRAMEP